MIFPWDIREVFEKGRIKVHAEFDGIAYDACIKLKKRECPDVISMTAQLSKKIAEILRRQEAYWNSFDRVIIYYDNGQIELTKIIICF